MKPTPEAVKAAEDEIQEFCHYDDKPELGKHVQAALTAQAAKFKPVVEALEIAEAHVAWGDCSLENAHRIAREALALARELMEDK